MKKLVIGIDIGGINTVLGLVDRTGEVYARSSFRTAEYPFFDDYPAYVETLGMMLRKLCGSMPADAVLTGIGIGAPNANYHTGRIERPVNLWKFRPEEPGRLYAPISYSLTMSGKRCRAFCAMCLSADSTPG